MHPTGFASLRSARLRVMRKPLGETLRCAALRLRQMRVPISGAGMLDFLACFSVEKLVVDAEAVAMAQRLLAGIQVRTDPLATDAFARLGPTGDFLQLPETRRLFRLEQWFPSRVIDRGTLGAWEESGASDTFARARERVKALLAAYARRDIAPDVERELFAVVRSEAKRCGLERLPGTEGIGSRD